jgi:hypothetical protein
MMGKKATKASINSPSQPHDRAARLKSETINIYDGRKNHSEDISYNQALSLPTF